MPFSNRAYVCTTSVVNQEKVTKSFEGNSGKTTRMEAPDSRSGNEDVVILKNARVCHEGVLLSGQLLEFSVSTGLILSCSTDDTNGPKDTRSLISGEGQEITFVDLDDDDMVVPGLIELQTNGLCGVHFTTLSEDNHEAALGKVSVEMAKNGITGWYATIPTVEGTRWKQVSTGLVFF